MRRSAGARSAPVLLSSLLLLGASQAAAQSANSFLGDTQLDIELFQPMPGASDLPGLQGSRVNKDLVLHGGLLFDYSKDPLTALAPDGSTVKLVGNRETAQALLSIGFLERFEVGLNLPLTFEQVDRLDGAGTQNVTGLQDLRLVPKAFLWGNDDLGVSVALPLWLPIGQKSDFLGSGALGIGPRVIADYRLPGNYRVGANLGARFRTAEREVLNLKVQNELTWAVGADAPLPVAEDMGLAAWLAFNGLVGFNGEGAASRPMDVLLGGRLAPVKNLNVLAGVGTSLGSGYGTPDVRAFAGVTYDYDLNQLTEPSAEEKAAAARALCLKGPEDLDGFEDNDNCNDPDNDNDGVLDDADKCPNEPETQNGYKDDDGCPDDSSTADDDKKALASLPKLEAPADSDSDSVPDALDKCPKQAEDADGFEDFDGCPDPDNDHDGIADGDDKCPLEAETINGVDDADGCPDAGEAKVQLEGDKITSKEPLAFAGQSDKLSPKATPLLQQVASILKARPELKLTVKVHTDEPASDDANLKLSQQRADNVKAALVAAGVEDARVTAKGMGKSEPLDTGKTPAAKEKNRRVELVVEGGAR